jgi:hypothetical protein
MAIYKSQDPLVIWGKLTKLPMMVYSDSNIRGRVYQLVNPRLEIKNPARLVRLQTCARASGQACVILVWVVVRGSMGQRACSQEDGSRDSFQAHACRWMRKGETCSHPGWWGIHFQFERNRTSWCRVSSTVVFSRLKKYPVLARMKVIGVHTQTYQAEPLSSPCSAMANYSAPIGTRQIRCSTGDLKALVVAAEIHLPDE